MILLFPIRNLTPTKSIHPTFFTPKKTIIHSSTTTIYKHLHLKVRVKPTTILQTPTTLCYNLAVTAPLHARPWTKPPHHRHPHFSTTIQCWISSTTPLGRYAGLLVLERPKAPTTLPGSDHGPAAPPEHVMNPSGWFGRCVSPFINQVCCDGLFGRVGKAIAEEIYNCDLGFVICPRIIEACCLTYVGYEARSHLFFFYGTWYTPISDNWQLMYHLSPCRILRAEPARLVIRWIHYEIKKEKDTETDMKNNSLWSLVLVNTSKLSMLVDNL